MNNMRTNEDLVHDAMVIIYDKYKQIDFEKGILPWAYGVLDNIIYGEYRTENRRDGIINDNLGTVLELYDNNESVDDYVDSCYLVDELWSALNQLNNTEKEIFKLILEGDSREKILEKLGISRTTLDVSVFRGRKKLKKYLERKGAL